jgi:hypothetical protein
VPRASDTAEYSWLEPVPYDKMKPCSLLVSVSITACVVPCSASEDAITLSTEAVPSPAAAEAILDQTAHEATMRLGPLDVFPHASMSVAYDDNVIITHVNPIHDVEWSITPGLMLALGDVSSSMTSPVSFDKLRGLLYYSLADDESRPQRFLALDYTAAANFYTDHSVYNNVDSSLRLSGGYTFSRLSVATDFDFFYGQLKDNGVGDLVTVADYDARVRTRYALSDITALELNGGYLQFNYIEPEFQGYHDFHGDFWIDRHFDPKLSAAVGVGLGYLVPEYDTAQTYEQALIRGIYALTGKSYFSASAGLEARQFGTAAPDALRPVFSLTGVFQPSVNTTITIEAHRREDTAPYQAENYIDLGASLNARQFLFNRFYGGLGGGYHNIAYTDNKTDNSQVRTDNYWYVIVNLDYEFNNHLMATLFYTYRTDDSTKTSASYGNNIVGLRVGWKY